MSLVAIINGVFGAFQAVKAVGEVINQLGALPSSAGKGSPSKGPMACCANPNAIPQQITHKVQLKRALTQLKNQVSGSDAVDRHEAFEINPVIDGLKSIAEMFQLKISDQSLPTHDESDHDVLNAHVSVVSELFKHLKGKAEDDDDRNAPLSKILDLLIQAVDGEQTHSNVLDLVQAHYEHLDDFKGLFQDLLTSSEPSSDSVPTESEPSSDSVPTEGVPEGSLKQLFELRASEDRLKLEAFFKELQTRQLQVHPKDSAGNKMPIELFEKLMKDVQKVLISFDPEEAASVDTLLDPKFAHLSLRNYSAAKTIQDGWLAWLTRNTRKAAVTIVETIFSENSARGELPPEVKSDASDRASAELPKAALSAALETAAATMIQAIFRGHLVRKEPEIVAGSKVDDHFKIPAVNEDKAGAIDAPLRENVQTLIASLRGAFQRSPVRHVVLVILSALATAPAVQPYWASLLSMITTSSQMQMLPIYGIGALALIGVLLLAQHHFEARALISSSPDEKSFFTPKTTDNIQKLHRRNGWLQIGLGALFVAVSVCAVYVQWPLIASVFVSSSLLVQGLMVALPALLVLGAVYFGVQDFKHHRKINDEIAEFIPKTRFDGTATAASPSVDLVSTASAVPAAAAADGRSSTSVALLNEANRAN